MANPTVVQVSKQAPQFWDMLQAQQQLAFQGNQAALQAVSKAWAPVLQTGAVPYGFSAGLDALLKSNIIDTGAANTANAMNAQDLRLKQESGGANVLPTGTQEALKAQTAELGGQATAKNLAAEKIAGYDQGLKNLEGGTQAELGVASGENETGLAGATNEAGNLALSAGAEEKKENMASGPLAIAGSIIGDISSLAGAATGLAGIGK